MNLYLRFLWTWLCARAKPAILLGDTIEFNCACSRATWINGRMNNGRYITITDLALVEYLTCVSFLPVALRNGWRPMLGGSIISFRRDLKPFVGYTLTFSMQFLDKRWTYFCLEFEHTGQKKVRGLTQGEVVGSHGIVSSVEARRTVEMDAVSRAYSVIEKRFRAAIADLFLCQKSMKEKLS